MTDKHLRALVAQALDIGIVGRVRALHLIAKVKQNFGYAGHADAANADKVNRAEFVRQFHNKTPNSVCGAQHEIGEAFGSV